ncbi:intradiol ring-cleavage dioxygenase [Sungkyunkwania multivorans]|uniref:Intradiol ring-cleavage dioxygenase n=1 Tax=Sungkyunkwania multivorans TaxID=1173618 RepID=A0ABW3CW77_9FLAO
MAICLCCSCQSQTKDFEQKINVGGPCEGCKALFEYGDQTLKSIDTLPDFAVNDSKLKIVGRVYQKDGRTPAKDVIIYIYQTDNKGIYPKKGDEQGWAKRHGYIRGWVKTGADGKYTFYTFRPASYPNTRIPQHIHATIKEPDKNAYYIADYRFDDDPYLSTENNNIANPRGGSGIMTPRTENGIQIVERDIILGKNIPNYE